MLMIYYIEEICFNNFELLQITACLILFGNVFQCWAAI